MNRLLRRTSILRLWLAASLCCLAGCAEQQLRQQSAEQFAAGRYVEAVTTLSDGLVKYPQSVSLRANLLNTRTESINRLIALSTTARASGDVTQAQGLLQQAQRIDPHNQHVQRLLTELQIESRQLATVSEAEKLWQSKRPETALRVIEQALKDNPRHTGLLALQRKIEAEQRQAQLRTARAALSESRPISLDFRDANLRTVLDTVSRNSGINFILDKDIRADARITVYLRQAKVEDALDLIVGTNQLAKKVVDAQTILVYPNTPEKQREYQEQVVRVFYLASAEAKGAAAFLKAMLHIRDPFVDERSNMLSLRDTQENIQLAERLIALYDAGDPEVLLDVEVLEVNSTRLTELGVKFPNSFSLTPLPPAGESGLNLNNIRNLTRDRIALGVGGVLVNLRREVGDFTTLANPRIRARNKEKAKILIGDKIPVITATTGQSGFVSDSVNYLDVGLKLDVEPTIYADDDVAIKVSLEVSSLGTSVKTASGTLAYQIGTRNAATLLRLHDNETQLLAGLISKDERTSASRVPGVGDLPVLGRLFSDQTDNSQRTELVLAITPHILRNIRRPDASETELWVGTDASPKLRPVGGLRSSNAPEPPASAAGPNAAGGASSAAQPAVPAEAPPEPKLPVEPKIGLQWAAPLPATVKVGDVIELSLALSSNVKLRGMPVELQFSSDRLTLLDVREGSFFNQGGAPTSFSKGNESKDGKLSVGVLRNQATGVTGEAPVMVLRLKATSPGMAQVRLMGAQPIAMDAVAAAPALPAPVSINIQ